MIWYSPICPLWLVIIWMWKRWMTILPIVFFLYAYAIWIFDDCCWYKCRLGPPPPLYTVKLSWLEHFMKVESVYHTKCFKDIKLWVEQSVLHKKTINHKTLSKTMSPTLTNPVFQQRILPVWALPYFTHYMKVTYWHEGGGGGRYL